MVGPPNIPIKDTILSFEFSKFFNLLSTSESIYRTPDTPLRFFFFLLSIIFFIQMILAKKMINQLPKYLDKPVSILCYLFLLTILISDDLYNYIAIILIVLSLVYILLFSENDLTKDEFILLSGYVFVFMIPFWSSLFHSTSLAEIDNYLRFLFAVPVFLTLRHIKFSLNDLYTSINLASFFIGIFALYSLIFLGETRVRGFTSTAVIFGNISLLFSLFSLLSLKYYSDKGKSILLPLLASSFAFFAWASTGSRGSILLILIMIILLFTKDFRKSVLIPGKALLAITVTVFIIFINSSTFSRYINAYESTYNYFTDGSGFYWAHVDSIVPRINIWKGVIILINDNFYTGIGLDNFNSSLASVISQKKSPPIRPASDNLNAGMNHAHNQYLDIFAKTGVFGFLSLIYFIISHFYYFYRQSRASVNIDGYQILPMIGILSTYGYMTYMISHSILSHQQSTLFMTLLLIILSGIIGSKIRSVKL